MPLVKIPRKWRILYSNGQALCSDEQLADFIKKEIKFIYDIELVPACQIWEKSDAPEFKIKVPCDNIQQLYVDDDIYLTSVDHAKDVIKDNRYWVIEKWLRNSTLKHYDLSMFARELDSYLKGRDTHNV